ncbi:competence/damage-inducible protein A [Staphylococcus gallinarum]|uniref:Putative competence-damage inducible protein n=1 Tax=Staphylococcus gallinarum TaxID=1293 RepID=A0A2T4SZB1_STAGA|nr:CinA family nicotinamide mononucleotide deamidase-related protein [Staphylococcus gallinarum]MCD8820334.1 CinA family nicotinamide mononucleotide deamidase-related protein [Staphylococcus gallinarum]PTL07107.1 competence/damage-inducible protein A [Staphylococcus gallinarum]PTL10879.1 competence/damage-inducible protein A [Staphylococcus gallinarum]RIL31206.1 CinA family nicotinamide mononucleotide deamidase-related protein [Staphylococcus gallinarum]RIL44628.1 CinA family nicotinamide mono
MNISIIAVGSELLLGQIANTNGQYLSQLLNGIGHSVVEHAVIGDNPERLKRVFNTALDNNDAVILTGGLGPTKDDLTKHTVAEVLGRELVTDSAALEDIEQYFIKQNVEMTPNNRQQALVIEGSEVLENKFGMAPGMLVKHKDKKVILLPGPPKEMQPMAKNELLPHLLDGEQIIFSELLRFAGIGESKVETELLDLIDNQTNPTIAPLAGTHEVNIRLTANGETVENCKALIDPIKTEILNRIGDFYYGSDDIKLEQALMQNIERKFAIYDGVTDGDLYSRLKDFDQEERLLGMLPHNNQFISNDLDIERQLSISTNIVKDLYKSEVAISLLYNKDTVYLGVLKEGKLSVQHFKMIQQRNLLKHRTQNYVLIRLLNRLKSQ